MDKSLKQGKPIRVFIVDSSILACQLMVRALQQGCKSITVVGSSAESVDVPEGLNKNSPDVTIVSADLKDGRSAGFQIVREVRVAYPHIRIILLVEAPEPAVIVEAFRAGADGAFSRAEPFERLCKCIHAVCQGQIWASSEELRFIIEAMAQKDAQPIKNANGIRLLTKREEELAQLVAEGLTNRDISRQLSLTEHTVRNYLFRIFNKLGTSNRLELALYVIKQRGADHGADLGRSLLAEPAPRSSNWRYATRS